MAQNVLFYNARIITGRYDECTANSLLVQGNRITKIGSYDECKAMTCSSIEEVDCQQNSLLPGFIDGHNHITLLGASLRAPKFHYPDVSCIEDVLGVVKNAVAARKEGEWIRGWGLDYGKFPNAKPPTRFDLDKVAPNNPVAIVHYTGHYVLVNSKALELAGIDDSVKDPEGGSFIRDAEGRLTGLARDSAQQMVVPTAVEVKHHGPDIGYVTPIEELVDDIKCACDALLAVGVTSVLDPQVTTREMTGLVRANKTGNLPVRTVAMFLSNHLEAQLELGVFEEFGNDFLTFGPIKYYADGAIVGGTAAFSEPHIDGTDVSKSLYWASTEEMCKSLKLCHTNGLQFAVHTQGDQAHELMLSCINTILAENPRADHRHRFEHSGYPLPGHIKQMAEYGIIPVTQPGQLREAGKNLNDLYGQERAKRIYPLRDFLDNNIPAVISSDAFVQSYNPISTVRGAVERLSDDGQDMGQDQRISMKEALICHTYNAAHAMFWEDKVGSLEEGKLADIVLLDCDIMQKDAKDLLDVKVAITMVDGKILYKA